MVFTLLVSFGVPVGLFFGLRKRFGLKGMPLLAGAIVFFVFVEILESVMHLLVLHPAADGTNALLPSHPWVYVAYGALAAGIFEETGRFTAFHILKKKFTGVRTAISYGIGHGGIEAILVAGVTMVSDLAISAMINTGNTNIGQATVTTLTGTAPYMFYMSGVERLLAILLHLSLSVFVWTAVTRRGFGWLYPVAILLHALADVPAAMYQAGKLTYAPVTILLVITVAIYLTCAIMLVRQALARERAEALVSEPMPQFAPPDPSTLITEPANRPDIAPFAQMVEPPVTEQQ